jgi:tetratricopeptide (TPR) repeat protein
MRTFVASALTAGAILAGSAPVASAAAPEDVTEARREAQRLIGAGEAGAAVTLLASALERHPRAAGLFAELGFAQLSRGKLEDAVRALESSLRLEPEQPRVRYNLAYALRERGRLEAAVDAYEAVLELEPKNADAWYGLAQTHEAREDPGAAALAYERYAETETRPGQEAWVERARTRALALRTGAAGGEEEPGDAREEGALREGATRSTTGAAARAGRRDAADRGEGSRPAAAARGESFAAALEALRQARYDAALAALEKLSPEVAETDYAVLAARAGAHLGRAEAEPAERLYRRALASAPDPAVPGILVGLAEAHRVRGELDAARALFERALAHPAIPPELATTARARLAGS